MKFYKKGEIIAEDGRMEKELFILMRGAVAIYKGDVKIAEFNETGTIIGEMSLILETKRTATIVAIEDSEVVNLKISLDLLIEKFPGIAKSIMKTMAERLANLTDNYWKLTSKTRAQDLQEFDDEEK